VQIIPIWWVNVICTFMTNLDYILQIRNRTEYMYMLAGFNDRACRTLCILCIHAGMHVVYACVHGIICTYCIFISACTYARRTYHRISPPSWPWWIWSIYCVMDQHGTQYDLLTLILYCVNNINKHQLMVLIYIVHRGN
jgi:hypothetical protein